LDSTGVSWAFTPTNPNNTVILAEGNNRDGRSHSARVESVAALELALSEIVKFASHRGSDQQNRADSLCLT
jgi:hypothetical protein